MKKKLFMFTSLLFVVFLAACGNAVDEAVAESYANKGKEMVQAMNAGEFEKITAQFDANLTEQLTVERLREITPVLEASGTLEQFDKESVQEKDGLKIVVLVAQHENDKRIYTITYDADDKIAGLFVQ